MQKDEHRAQRDALRHGYRQTVKDVRARASATGQRASAFLGRVSGVDLIRRTVHRYQDAQRLKAYRAQSRDLKDRQWQETHALEARAAVQTQEMGRKEGALGKVGQRELAAFMRDQRTKQRVHDRGEDGVMPSLEHLIKPEAGAKHDHEEADLLGAFEKAKSRAGPEPPDLFAAAAPKGGFAASQLSSKQPVFAYTA